MSKPATLATVGDRINELLTAKLAASNQPFDGTPLALTYVAGPDGERVEVRFSGGATLTADSRPERPNRPAIR